MEICEAHALGGQLVKIWGPNLAAKTGEIGEPKVISDDDEKIRALLWWHNERWNTRRQ
jgi:hypothetical protein